VPHRWKHQGLTFSVALVLGVLLSGCASGPRYGASHGRKKKKSCDCPHWNAVQPVGDEAHADARAVILH